MKTIKFNKKIIIWLVVFFVLGFLYLANSISEHSNTVQNPAQKITPDIDIENTLRFDSELDLFFGSASGLVGFVEKDDQPKSLRQYYIIEALGRFDENDNQFFSVDDVVAVGSLPPQSIGKSKLVETSNSYRLITLEDDFGNQYFIDKFSNEVTMEDMTGDKTRLITSPAEFAEFIPDF